MNITYLIGNGFDIKLDLRNRYIDFYKSYVAVPSKSDTQVIKTFKAEINDFIKEEIHKEGEGIDWRDLEVALGKYTSKVPLEEFDKLYFDIVEHLKTYLAEEYEYFDPRLFKSEGFLVYLCNPISGFFTKEQEAELRNYMRSFSGDDVIDVINFNYTPTIEQLSGFEGQNLPIGKSVSGRTAQLRSIRHIHQSLTDEDILVGVNDKSQIENPDYKKSQDICELLVKPSTNKVLGTGINAVCEDIIRNTNLFVLFGTSAGITDSKWWNLICERMLTATSNYARMLFFVHLQDTNPHQRVRYGQLSRSDIRRFVQNAGFADNIFDSIYSNIYVSYSSEMFHMPITSDVLNIPKEVSHNYASAKAKVTLLNTTMRNIVARVDAPTESYGVDMEHGWIKEVFPDYTVRLQSLIDIEIKGVKIPFDRITISNGVNRKNVYFDISSFYSKSSIPGRLDLDKEIINKIGKY